MALLTACKKAKNNNNYNAKEAGDKTVKFKVNKRFLKKNFELKDNGSDSKSRSKSKDNKLDNNLENLN